MYSWIIKFSPRILSSLVERIYTFFAQGLTKFWCGGVDNSFFLNNFSLFYSSFKPFSCILSKNKAYFVFEGNGRDKEESKQIILSSHSLGPA